MKTTKNKKTKKVEKTKKAQKGRRKLTKQQKIIIITSAILIIAIIIVVIIFLFILPKNEDPTAETWEETEPEIEEVEPIYSVLTGLEIPDANLNSSPTYCVQIPNGSTDGARPQAGLNAAAIVFEAIAEAGITRFAAIFQNPEVSAIGPIRSLRPYYLDWDTPFDCTVVHAGGSAEAIAALRSGGQRDLNENYTYMWRETGTGRNWNNLFTSPSLLNQYNLSRGWSISLPKAFARLTPTEVSDLQTLRSDCQAQAQAQQSETAENSEEEPQLECPAYTPATSIKINFSANYSHNVLYAYDPASNTYLRSHQDGKPHLSYNCPTNLEKPSSKTACGEPTQVAPSVVVAMRVSEGTMADNYHQRITTIGSGEATIFQNGEVIPATWTKSSQAEQIVFKDANGETIPLTPGQLWISAVPQYGSVSYQ